MRDAAFELLYDRADVMSAKNEILAALEGKGRDRLTYNDTDALARCLVMKRLGGDDAIYDYAVEFCYMAYKINDDHLDALRKMGETKERG